jgi:argininosuccinate lyase
MWWRRRSRNDELIAAALLDLNARVATIEQALVIIVDHIEQLEAQRKPRVARVIPQWPADTQKMTVQ